MFDAWPMAASGRAYSGDVPIGQKGMHERCTVAVRRSPSSIPVMAEARDYRRAINERVVVYDGGMGATLEQFELTSEDNGGLQGKCHEALVLNRPDVIEGVHASMLDAGAEVIETDTFQASRLKLGEWGLAEHTHEINVKAAQIARRAAGEQRFVAGSIGPTGFLPASEDPSLGQIRFRELVEVFREQALGLVEGGADLIIIETAQDILEVKAAIFGAREAFKESGRALPIHASGSLLTPAEYLRLNPTRSSDSPQPAYRAPGVVPVHEVEPCFGLLSYFCIWCCGVAFFSGCSRFKNPLIPSVFSDSLRTSATLISERECLPIPACNSDKLRPQPLHPSPDRLMTMGTVSLPVFPG